MTDGVLLAVPNISEGRDTDKIARIAGSDALLDSSSDVDHNRTVLTYGGVPDQVLSACVAMVDRAASELDVNAHDGVHPRFGVVDVLPFVPYATTEEEALRVASEASWKIAQGPGIPVHQYGFASDRRLTLPMLRRKLAHEATTRHPTAGVICIGIREPLIAFNVNCTGTIEAAKHVCHELRKVDGTRALAFALPSREQVQLSMNLYDLKRTRPRKAFRHATRWAAKLGGLEIVDAEVVGLVTEAVRRDFDKIPMRAPVRSVEQALRMTHASSG